MLRFVFLLVGLLSVGAGAPPEARTPETQACRTSQAGPDVGGAIAAAAARSRLAQYFELSARRLRIPAGECGWDDVDRLQRYWLFVEALYHINRLEAASALSEEGLIHWAASEQAETLRMALQSIRIGVAIERRDGPSIQPLLRDYEAARKGRDDPPQLAAEMDYIRDCIEREDLPLRCRSREDSFLFGQFARTVDSEGRPVTEGQCPAQGPFSQEQIAPGSDFEAIARAALAVNAACARERRIAAHVFNWWQSIVAGDPRKAVDASRLITDLDAWALEIDRSDGDNAVSRFQTRALAFFVRQKDRQMRCGACLDSPSEQRRGQSDEAAIAPYFEKALPPLLRGESGFLRVDNVGLAAFVVSQLPSLGKASRSEGTRDSQSEALWKLVGLTFGSSQREPPRPLEAMRAGLRAQDVLVTAVHAQDGSGAILVARRDGPPQVRELTIAAPRVRKIFSKLEASVRTAPNALSTFPLAEARELYGQYICPLEQAGPADRGSGKSSGPAPASGPGRLIIVPDATLEQIPLPLLARPAEGCDEARTAVPADASEVPVARLAEVDWLADRYSLRIVPYTSRSPGRSRSAPHGYVGIGDPKLPSPMRPQPVAAKHAALLAQSDAAARSDPLRFARREFARIYQIAHLDGVPALTGLQATELEARRLLREPRRIVHFATHALTPLASADVIEPLLVLSRPAGPFDPANDGVLTASEIAALRLPGTVVVLSACQTVRSKPGIGFGLFSGLVQSFFDAGTEWAVASYWKINDAAAVELVPPLIEALTAGRDPADALRAAQQRFRRQFGSRNDGLWRHPYFWAGFIVAAPATGEFQGPPR